MSEDGYVPISRRFFHHYLWSEQRSFSRAEAWLDLVQLATYQDRKVIVNGKMIDVKRGGIVASERFLLLRWMWSRTKVRSFLDMLQQDNMIKLQKDHGITLITLSNYETYNNVIASEKPQKYKSKTTEEPPRDQNRIKNNKGNKGKELEASPWARPDSLDEVVQFCTEQQLPRSDAEYCWNHWISNGFTNNRQPIKNWKATIRAWKCARYLPSQKQQLNGIAASPKRKASIVG